MRTNQLFIVAAAIFMGGCAATSGTADREAAHASASCPPSGTRVPYKKLTALAQDYVGCDVEVEVQLLDAAWGNFTCLNAPVAGNVQFRFLEPGAEPKTAAFGGVEGYLALIPKSASDPVLSASNGQRLLLRGGTFWQSFGGEMAGQGCGVFVATSARPAE